MTRRALITGITGQDGAYLAQFLLRKGYEVYGTYRRLSTANFWRLQYLEILDKVHLVPADLADTGSMHQALKISQPDEIYHLAAQSFVETSFETPVSTGDITGISVARILEIVLERCSHARFYFAATSEMFGSCGRFGNCLNEANPFNPMSPYAAAKLYGYWITRIYREAYGLYAANGILFNHESPLRGLEFVTRKISNEVARIALGLSKELKLGKLDAERDWGYAPEYVESMWLMLQHPHPDDYVIATGKKHSVLDFVQTAFDIVGLDWESYVRIDSRLLRPLDVPSLSGDHSKATRELGWKPRIAFNDLVEIMVEEEMTRWKGWQNGDRFAWDIHGDTLDNPIITKNLRNSKRIARIQPA